MAELVPLLVLEPVAKLVLLPVAEPVAALVLLLVLEPVELVLELRPLLLPLPDPAGVDAMGAKVVGLAVSVVL